MNAVDEAGVAVLAIGLVVTAYYWLHELASIGGLPPCPLCGWKVPWWARLLLVDHALALRHALAHVPPPRPLSEVFPRK